MSVKKPSPRHEVQDEDAVKLCQTALDLLARREHTYRELTHKLYRRGFAAKDIESLLQDLTKQGLLNHSRFAEQYIHSRAEKGFGPLRICAELSERGVEGPVYEEVLSYNKDMIWDQRATQARVKRYGAGVPKDFKERARQMRFLQQRGFTQEQIRNAFGSSE